MDIETQVEVEIEAHVVAALFEKLNLRDKFERINDVYIDEIIEGVRVVGHLKKCHVCREAIGSIDPCMGCRLKDIASRLEFEIPREHALRMAQVIIEKANSEATLRFIKV